MAERMPRRGFTIARLMAGTATIALNGAPVRGFLLHEIFVGVVLLWPAIQVAAWRGGHAAGRQRWFWLGCAGAGVGVTLGLLWGEADSGSPPSRLLAWYLAAAIGRLAACLPNVWPEWGDDRWHLVLAVLYAIPEEAGMLVGGVVVAAAYRPRREGCKDANTPRP